MPTGKDWHQRWHPLREEWVVYSAHRNKRPWVGQVEEPAAAVPPYDATCYLCPGNGRSGGNVNPQYEGVFVFDNDHPVVGPAAPVVEDGSYYKLRRASGLARVICYDPRHDLTLTQMPLNKVAAVVSTWREEVGNLANNPEVRFALLFENRGEVCGTSSPHPHCQLYGTNFVFKNVEQELSVVRKEPTIFSTILREESAGPRVVAENDHAIAFVPFFARYPYEVWLFPKRQHADLRSVTDEEIRGIGAIYLEVTRRYDELFGMPFPFVMSLYQAPFDLADETPYHFHFVFLPPLRQPGVQKFPAGPEIGGGNFMNDTLPEDKAAELKAVTLSPIT